MASIEPPSLEAVLVADVFLAQLSAADFTALATLFEPDVCSGFAPEPDAWDTAFIPGCPAHHLGAPRPSGS